MCINTFPGLVLLALCAAWSGQARAAEEPTHPPAAERMPANVQLVETVMRREALHRLNSTTGVRLPRIRVFAANGDKLLYVVGWAKDVPARLQRALQQQRPLPSGESLADLLAQIDDSAGQPLTVEKLPPGDVVIVTAWAGWCLPCAPAISGLRDAMAADSARRYVWITVETDAYKQKLLMPGARNGG
ncbi:MAG: hypothetical protein ABI411_03490 [Tahibacter sp.]